jgi:protein SCO1
MIGLTGTPEQVDAVTRAFRVYSSRPPLKALGENDDQDYLVDHSVFAYLMDPDGMLARD